MHTAVHFSCRQHQQDLLQAMGEVPYDLQKVRFFLRNRPNSSYPPRGRGAWRATSLLADSLAETIQRIC